jgi:hypothetical protein
MSEHRIEIGWARRFFEAKAVVARQGAAAPAQAPAAAAPPPAPAAPIPGYDKMTFAQRWVAGEVRRKAGTS